MNLIKLGIGTTWFGRKWPPNNNNYNAPDFDEIENHFNKVFGMLKNGEMLMIDTAPSYGDSEEKIGRAKTYEEHLQRGQLWRRHRPSISSRRSGKRWIPRRRPRARS